jgi:hypothetical protein
LTPASPVIVPGQVVAIEEVPADDVVDIAVLVVVDAVAHELLRIAPQAVPVDVLVIPVEPAVDDRDNDRLGIRLDQPPRRLRRGVEPDPVQSPLVGEILAPRLLAAEIVCVGRSQHAVLRLRGRNAEKARA